VDDDRKKWLKLLRRLDEAGLREYMTEHHMPGADAKGTDFWRTIHLERLACEGVSITNKRKSCRWLRKNGVKYALNGKKLSEITRELAREQERNKISGVKDEPEEPDAEAEEDPDEIRLKPCPFCGSPALLVGKGDLSNLTEAPLFYVACLSVKDEICRANSGDYPTWRAALDAWNMRPEDKK